MSKQNWLQRLVHLKVFPSFTDWGMGVYEGIFRMMGREDLMQKPGSSLRVVMIFILGV